MGGGHVPYSISGMYILSNPLFAELNPPGRSKRIAATYTAPTRSFMPKIVDHEERRNEIADTVLALIAAGGTKAVTTRSVAKQSGWSAGTVNHYFVSREGLMLGALRRAAQLQGEEIRKALHQRDMTPMQRLHQMTESILPLDERRVAMTKIFLDYYAESNGQSDTQEEVVQYLRNWRKAATRLIQECKDDGSIVSSREASTLAIELVALTDGLSMHALMDPDVLTPIMAGKRPTISFIGDSWGPVSFVDSTS